jgi:periplasmic divalent cation tolerance protein
MTAEDKRFSLIYVTCPNAEEAERLGRGLVEQKLAASANVIAGMTAIYPWKGKIEKAGEVVLLLKTQKRLVKKAITALSEQHTYDVPAILEIPLGEVGEKFKEWLIKETS